MGAIIVAIIGMAIIWGGLALSIMHAIKKNKEEAKS